mmetsp:Transcript_14697/g.59770  ORF Transcript_14697/g.59770 Transcript_14697/m.59770 type:complete len:91 (-) Transcript_14697:1879-2151(-)
MVCPEPALNDTCVANAAPQTISGGLVSRVHPVSHLRQKLAVHPTTCVTPEGGAILLNQLLPGFRGVLRAAGNRTKSPMESAWLEDVARKE